MRSKHVRALLFLAVLSAGISFNIKNTYAVDNKYDTAMEALYASTYQDIFYDKTPGSPLEYEAEDGVDTATGHLSLQRCDLYLQGTGGMDFELSRFYNSNDAGIGHPVSKSVDEIDVNNIYVKFKGEDGKTHSLTVASDIYKNHKNALKDMLYNYTKGDKARDDEVKDTQKTKVVNGIPYNVYGISTGWSFDFPWIETMSIKEGEESEWAQKPVYLHFGSRGSMAIATKAKKKKKTYKITGFEGYNYSDIKLENISKKVDGVKCKYLLRDKTGMRTYFNADGVVVLQKDAHNNTIKYTYRDKIYFDKITDSVGREIVFHYGEEKNGMRFLEKVTVQGKKVKGGVSAKTIKYSISEKSYTPKNGSKIYGSVLNSVTVDGTKETYGYRTVETFVNTSGYLIAGHRADTNQAYLINSVESEGCRTCYEYRAGAIRGTRDAGEGQKRDVATQFYYVTREYDQDVKTGKKANGIKYDYFQKQKGEKSLTTYFDFSTGTEARQYGEDGLSNVTVESSYNPKKHKDNGLVSDYTYKVSDIDFESLHLEKQPKKNVSLSVYNTNRLLTDEVEEGKEKSETLYDYDDDGKGSLVVLETEKEYGKNRSGKPVTTKEGYGYDNYRNVVTEKDSKAYLAKNAGKEYLFTTTYSYFNTDGGYPVEDVPYSLCTLIQDEEYLNKTTKARLIASVTENGADYVNAEEQIKEGEKEYRTISKSDLTYNNKGELTCEKVYPYYGTRGIGEAVQYDYTYDALGQLTKENVSVSSAKNSAWNLSFTEEEKTFDSFGNELTYTDRSGLTANSEYDENTGEVIKSTDAVGTDYESSDNTMTSEDKLKTMTLDNYNRCVVEIQDAFGNTVIEKDEKAGTWTESTYDYGEEESEENDNDADTEGLLVEEKVYAFKPVGDKIIKDENGEDVPNFDIGGRGNEILSGSRYVYDDYGEEIVKAAFSGGAMDSGHCSSWTLSKQTEEVEDGKIVSTSYTKQLNPKHYQEQVDKNHYYNQFDGYVLSETIEESVQDEEGNIISETSTYKRGNGISESITKYTYDEFGKVAREEASTKKYQDGEWLPAKETQKLYEYDYQGNVIKTETRQKTEGEDKWESQITRSVYNEQGQLIEAYSPKGVKEGYCTTYEYDLLGRMVKERTPLEKKDGVIRYQTKSMEYDINDNLIAEEEEQTDSQTMRAEYSYDLRGNLAQVKNCLEDGKAQYTQYVYDTEGNKIRQYTGLTGALTLSVKEGVGENLYEYAGCKYNVIVSGKKKKDVYSETKYEYNKRNELTAIVDPEGRRETYAYDTYGNLVKTVDKNGNVIRNDYDFQNRIVKKEAKEKETGEVTAHTYSYNAYGELSKQDNTTFEYGDVSGLVTKEVTRSEDGADISKSYTYSSDDNRTSFAVAVGDKTELSLSYTYDAFSRLSAVNSTAGDNKERIAEYSYDENGNLAGRTTGENGLDISYQYDLSDHVTDLENKVNGKSGSNQKEGQKISSFHSEYLKNGQKSSEKSEIYSETEQTNISKTSKYTYDRLGRLIRETRTGSDDISYTYDAHNNRKEMKCGNKVTAYRYNRNDELFRTDTLNTENEQDSVTLYKNDKNGNELAKVSRQETESKGETYFNLDISIGDNRLNENVVNHYNALNELTETLTKDTKVSYEYDAEGLRTKKTVNGETVTYVWDGDQLVMELDDKGNVLKRYIRGTSLIYSDRGDETDRQYYVMNPHGDVVQLLNQSGKVTKTYEYDSFGNEVDPDKDDDNPFRYSGEYYDKETESIYLRARYYQPSVGRFLTRDTYTGEDDDPLSLNLYTYCGNDSVNNVDPSGHFFETLADILSLGDSLYCMVTEPSLVNAGFVAWDVVSLLPGVPGSYVAKLTKKASKAAEVVKASKAGTKVKVAMEKGKKIVKASKKAIAKLAKKLKPKKSLKKISPGNNKFLKKIGKSGGKKPKKVKKKTGTAVKSSGTSTTGIENLLKSRPELTGTIREKLLSAVQNSELYNIVNELYRPGATIGDGGTASMLVQEYYSGSSKHLIKAKERLKQLKRLSTSGKLGLNDLDIVEELIDDLESAIKLFN